MTDDDDDDDDGQDEAGLDARLARGRDAGAQRRFAVACCRRTAHLCPDPRVLRVIEVAANRAGGTLAKVELDASRAVSAELYHTLYPGHGSPSARALALAAAGEAAFTDDALAAARNASSTAARAFAVAAAAKVADRDDVLYDAVHDAAYAVERAAQMKLLER